MSDPRLQTMIDRFGDDICEAYDTGRADAEAERIARDLDEKGYP